MTGSPGQTLPLLCMLKDLLVDILSNTGLYLVVLICFQKICGLHGVDHQIIQYSEKEKVITDKSTDRPTDRQTEFPI